MTRAYFVSRIILRPALFAAGLASLLAACSSDDGGAGGASAACVGGKRASSALTAVDSSEFCAADEASLDAEYPCTYTLQCCGVALKAAAVELARSPNVEEYSGSGAPQVACFSAAGYPDKPGTSSKVTVEGIAKLFSHGCESHDLKIEYWTVKRTGGADDGEPDALVGTAVTTPTSCEGANGVESTKNDPDKCSTATEKPWHCKYTYADVPSETELLIKTSGGSYQALYEYNVFIPNADVKNGTFTKDVRALVKDDYNTIAQVALGSSITPTHGAVAGEVHDCGDVRLLNAVVDIDADKKQLVYFSNDEDHPLPDQTADSTGVLGLYAAIDVKPGPVTVAAVGLVGDKPTAVGFFNARVFPDSVTSVTFRGLRPFQVP